MLCALGSAVFATATASVTTGVGRATAWIALAAGFGLTTWVRSGRAIDASWTAGLIGLVAAWQLVRPGRAMVMIAASGALAALWASILQAAGVPRLLAVPSAAVVPIVSAYLSARTPRFAPLHLREEAGLVILILAVVAGAAPIVSRGWQSALALNVTVENPPALVPIWTMSFVGLSMALGGVWSLWRRG